MATGGLTEAHRIAYERDGFALVRGLIDPDTTRMLTGEFDHLVER